ncbi:MAG: TatD family hydrolase [Bacteroidetes bacterium]|nr:TatD family hydrolase [Bacteroidota bacterium]
MPLPYTDAHTHFRYRPPQQVKFVRNAFLLKSAGTLAYPVCCGLHPWLVEANWSKQIDLLAQLVKQPNVVAVGECGLDYAHGNDRRLQHEAFSAQLALANEAKKPLVLHVVKALHDLPPFLKTAQVTAVLHGYRGNAQQTAQLLEFDVMFSIGTRMLRQPEQLKQLVQHIPTHKLLLETDTTPHLLPELYNQTATLLNISEDALRMQVFSNFARTFSIE